MSEIDLDELLRELAVLVDEERRVSTCVLSALSMCNSCFPAGSSRWRDDAPGRFLPLAGASVRGAIQPRKTVRAGSRCSHLSCPARWLPDMSLCCCIVLASAQAPVQIR